ncbi:hypothetical protein [Pantoea agglomerans]|uniref:hypothetical protein n=1 Tax=Enterobacter agglomerans TaxID=549 RepID=UPI0016548882|nr:hypothetical protein [Pantoea agglomerans]
MKSISDIEVFAELASARDGLEDMTDRLYQLYTRAKNDETPEGRLLARTVRDLQLQLCDSQRKIADIAACYH